MPQLPDGTPASTSVEPLAAIEQWGVPHPRAAVVDSGGVVHRRGDTARIQRVASLAKLATALAVLMAVEETTVELDEPAGPPGSTVRHLLCHASGFDFDTDSVLAEPGTRRVYSNTGYEALAQLVAQRSGMAFETYLAEGILGPLGMRHTRLEGSAARGLWSNIEDLLLLAAEWRRPSLLHHSTLVEARRAQLPDLGGVLPGWGRQDPCPWGLGPELRGTKSPHWTGGTASAATFGHFGGTGTLLWIDPEVDVTCIALSEQEFGDWAVEAWPPFSDAVRAAYS